MKKISFLVPVLVVLAALSVPQAVGAVDVFPVCDTSDPGSAICAATSDKLFGEGSIWQRILDIFTYIIGAVSVLMIIIGGFRYVTSNGDQAQITSAKNTILYAVIGLVVAVLAYSIVHFVLSNI